MAKTKKNSYTEEDVQKALKEIKMRGISKKKASVIFNVPRSTLQFRLSQKFTKTTKGPTPFLSKEEEKTLVKWIEECSLKGFPRRKEDIFSTVKEFLEHAKRPNPFKNNYPGRGWYNSFLKRNPELTLRVPEPVTSASGNVSETNIRFWFKNIESYLTSKNLLDILNDPDRIFNGDETGFSLSPKQKNVLAIRGSKNVYEIDSGAAKTNITVMFTFSASGIVTPPMVIYPLKRITAKIRGSVPGHWGIGLSDNGWMKAEVFFEYISNVLYPYLVENNTQFPIILFVDGHKTHMTYHLSVLCTSLKIILIALYPNSTRLLQPADVAAFRPIKSYWQQAVLEWRSKNPYDQITKENFAPILTSVINQIKPNTIRNGFRACGLFPWNENALDYTKCMGKNLKNSNTETVIKPDCSTKEIVPVLTYNEFCEIVGEQKLQEIENSTSAVVNIDPDLAILKNLYQRFKAGGNASSNGFLGDDLEKSININETEITEKSINLTVPEKDETELLNDVINVDIHIQPESKLPDGNAVDFNKLPQENDKPRLIDESTDENRCVIIEEANDMEISDSDVAVFDLEDIPIVLQKDNGNFEIEENITNDNSKINIQQIIRWPATPAKKGKQSLGVQMPYVITSTGWKELHEKKEQEKQEKEMAKEERKKERLLKQSEKEKTKKLKQQKKGGVKKAVTKNEEKNGKQPELKRKVETNSEEKSSKKSNTEEDIEENKSQIKVKEPIKPSHVRKIFEESDEKDERNNNSETTNLNNQDAKLHSLCYACAKYITKNKRGLKCSSCVRTYHYLCLFKNQAFLLTSNVFTCKACQVKVTSNNEKHV